MEGENDLIPMSPLSHGVEGEDNWILVSPLRKVLEGLLWAVVNMAAKETTRRQLDNCRFRYEDQKYVRQNRRGLRQTRRRSRRNVNLVCGVFRPSVVDYEGLKGVPSVFLNIGGSNINLPSPDREE